jgi:hypothetical protein
MTKQCKNTGSTPKPKPPRRYNYITDSKRLELIDLITNNQMLITEAAAVLGIKYENAKAIYRVFKTNGRLKRLRTFKVNGKFVEGQ